MDRLTSTQITKIAKATAGQRTNPLWQRVREKRLTASFFGTAIRLARSKNATQIKEFKDRLFIDKNLANIPPIKWGTVNEKKAISEYEHEFGYHVKETGIWLFPDGYLGASPDGLVFDGDKLIGLIEVKCPWAIRRTLFSNSNEMVKALPYLCFPKNLNPEHDYYHQVQGQLAATGASWCDFFVWTPHNYLCIRILPDENWKKINIPMLNKFYCEHLMRPEDDILLEPTLQLKNLKLDGMDVDPQPLDISVVLNPHGPSEELLCCAVIESITMHIARRLRLIHLRGANPVPGWWDTITSAEWDLALKLICYKCVKRYCMYYQSMADKDPAHQWVTRPEVDWSVLLKDPKSIFAIGLPYYVSKLYGYPDFPELPCMCLYYPPDI